MDFDALIAFHAIVREKSFSKAAETLHLTQPAISKRILNLEDKLGVQLFDRLQKEVVLTNEGEALLPHALDILHSADNARQAVQRPKNLPSGQLRILASHHIGIHRLPFILKEFTQRFPEVELKLNFLDSEGAYEILRNNGADLAFITLPDEAPEVFETHLTWKDPLSFCCAPDFPLAKLEEITVQALAQHHAILPSQTTFTYRVVEKLFKLEGLPLQSGIPTNYLETMKMMTSVGMGWTVLPRTMIDDSLTTLDFESPGLMRILGAVSYSKKHLSLAAVEFLKIARTKKAA